MQSSKMHREGRPKSILFLVSYNTKNILLVCCRIFFSRELRRTVHIKRLSIKKEEEDRLLGLVRVPHHLKKMNNNKIFKKKKELWELQHLEGDCIIEPLQSEASFIIGTHTHTQSHTYTKKKGTSDAFNRW